MTDSFNEDKNLGFNLSKCGQESGEEVSLLDFLQTIVDNLRLLVLGPLVVGTIALGFSFYIPPTYTAKTQFLPPQQQQSSAANMLASLGSLGGLAGAVSGIKNPADQFIAYMKSVTFQDSIIERFNLLNRYEALTKTDARLALSGKVRVTSGKDGLMSVEVDDKDPQFAADLANAHVEELVKLLSKLATTEAQQRRLFFEKQLDIAREKLTQSEIALKATGVSEGVLKSNPTSAVAAVAGIQAGITAQEIKVGAMRGYLAETSPDFKLAMNELANLKVQLAKQEKDSPLNVAKSTTGGDYITKYREFKYQETLFELFSRQFELAKVDEAREGAVIQVLDIAKPPEKKAKPQKALIAVIATMAAGVALILFVLIRQALNMASKEQEFNIKFNQIKASFKKAIGKV